MRLGDDDDAALLQRPTSRRRRKRTRFDAGTHEDSIVLGETGSIHNDGAVRGDLGDATLMEIDRQV